MNRNVKRHLWLSLIPIVTCTWYIVVWNVSPDDLDDISIEKGVITRVNAESAFDIAGLRPGDKILVPEKKSEAGIDLQKTGNIHLRWNPYEAGKVYNVQVERGGTPLKFNIIFQSVWSAHPLLFTLYYIFTFLVIFSAIFILLKKPEDKSAILFYRFAIILSATVSTCYVLTPSCVVPGILFILSYPFISASFYHFILYSPEPESIDKKFKNIPFLLYTAALIFGFNHAGGFLNYVINPTADNNLIMYHSRIAANIWMGSSNLFAVIYSFIKYTKISDSFLKNQFRWILLGIIFGVLAPMLTGLLQPLLVADITLWARLPNSVMYSNFISIPIMITAFIFAITKYRVWNFEVILRTGLLYSVVTSIIIGIYFLFLYLAETIFSESSTTEKVFGLAAAVLAFIPVRETVQKSINNIFYREELDPAQSIMRFEKNLLGIYENSALYSSILTEIDRIFHPEKCALYLKRKQDVFENTDSLSPGSRLQAEKEFIKKLENIRPFAVSELNTKINIPGAEIIIPVISDAGLTGFLTIGRKKSGQSYTMKDLNLLQLLAQRILSLLNTAEIYRKEIEAEKYQELSRIQASFFTNISHEFRTPLTLIMGPVKQIAENIDDGDIKEELNLVYRNASRLLRLVNQLLDIAKVESGNMKLAVRPMDIVELIRNITESFTPFAEKKKLNLDFKTSVSRLNGWIDKDKVEKIITNILSNAVKFTPENGDVEISVTHTESGYAEISISDTGIGIPAGKLSKIFDRFYQAENKYKKDIEGTGIGLALSKELVELHKGQINFESSEGKGSIFIVRIPLQKEHYNKDEIAEQEIYEAKVKEPADLTSGEDLLKKADPPLLSHSDKELLIIDDNSDVRNYIKRILNWDYSIYEADNGVDGLKKSLELVPDLIISDIMMPKMDGVELCRKLKQDERTSHIPVILLTAKAARQDKIGALEEGADAYIVKPFEVDELKATIKNLIVQRTRLHEHFRHNDIYNIEESKVTNADKIFLEKIFRILNDSLCDPTFNVQVLANKAAVNRTILYKKILALTGEPPVDIIRRGRLKKAADLIKKKFGNISEIAFEAGFSNPAYFSECFKKEYGLTPSEYKEKFSQ